MHDVRRQRIRRIGFLIGVGYPHLVTALNEELRKLGYIVGEVTVLLAPSNRMFKFWAVRPPGASSAPANPARSSLAAQAGEIAARAF